MAPNVLTAAGFVSQMLGFLAMTYYNADFKSPVPTWVYFFCAFTLFVYQSLDNIDGKQARRTKSSSPLGELFDHVSDSMGVGMMVTTIGASCRAGPLLTLLVFFAVITPFYFHHWEEKFTGELILGKFDGPTESQVFVMVLHVANGCFSYVGYDFWCGKELLWGYKADVLGPVGFSFLCLLSSIKLQARFWTFVSKAKISVAEALSVGLPFFTFFISAIIYTSLTPELLQHHHWDESRLLFFFLTIQFGYLTSRLIVQRVCHEPSPVIYPISVPLALVALHALLHRFYGVPHFADPHLVLKVIGSFAAFQCLWFFRQLNDELTSYLKIDTFHIPYPPPADKPKKVQAKATPTRRARSKSPRRSRSRSAARKKVE